MFGDAADFNGDGKADILWQNDNGTPAVMPSPAAGLFIEHARAVAMSWSKGRAVAGTPMNDSIFHAQPLQTKVLRSARCLVKIEKYPVYRIPTGDDLIDLLVADCLPQNRKPPQQFGAGAFQKVTQSRNILLVDATIRETGLQQIPIHVQHQYGTIAPALGDASDDSEIVFISLQVGRLQFGFDQRHGDVLPSKSCFPKIEAHPDRLIKHITPSH